MTDTITRNHFRIETIRRRAVEKVTKPVRGMAKVRQMVWQKELDRVRADVARDTLRELLKKLRPREFRRLEAENG